MFGLGESLATCGRRPRLTPINRLDSLTLRLPRPDTGPEQHGEIELQRFTCCLPRLTRKSRPIYVPVSVVVLNNVLREKASVAVCYACFAAEIDGRRLGRALPGTFRSIISLTGALTVKLEDGSNTKFKSGESFFQPRMEWHRCVNEGKGPMRCLLVLPRAKVPALPQRVN